MTKLDEIRKRLDALINSKGLSYVLKSNIIFDLEQNAPADLAYLLETVDQLKGALLHYANPTTYKAPTIKADADIATLVHVVVEVPTLIAKEALARLEE